MLGILTVACRVAADDWSRRPPAEWPPITMINEIEYARKHFPIAGCAFLLDTGSDTLAATAKHILTYFKSDTMSAVSFAGTLVDWRMYPKDRPRDLVVVDSLINEDPGEPIDRIPAPRDWLLFTLRECSSALQPLEMRMTPLQAGEPVYIVGWRYSDKDCPQVIYEGAVVREEEGSVIISTLELADNKMPGLSGSPVIDGQGRVIGLMSQKAGKHERVASLAYPQAILAGRAGEPDGGESD
jgi:hypothetical protein